MINYERIVLKGKYKEKFPDFHKNTMSFINAELSLTRRYFISGHVRIAKMVNYKRIALKDTSPL